MNPPEQQISICPRVAVVGAGQANAATLDDAEAIGKGLGSAGAHLICGGRGGVMEAAARGCRQTGGLTIGVLPGADATETPPNDWIEIPIYSAAGQGRNLIVVLSADVVIALGGGWGTLSEVSLARKHGRPVVALGTWRLATPQGELDSELVQVASPAEAVSEALRIAERRA